MLQSGGVALRINKYMLFKLKTECLVSVVTLNMGLKGEGLGEAFEKAAETERCAGLPPCK